MLLVKAIRQLEDNVLAKEVFEQQLEMGWPGLAKEASQSDYRMFVERM